MSTETPAPGATPPNPDEDDAAWLVELGFRAAPGATWFSRGRVLVGLDGDRVTVISTGMHDDEDTWFSRLDSCPRRVLAAVLVAAGVEAAAG